MAPPALPVRAADDVQQTAHHKDHHGQPGQRLGHRAAVAAQQQTHVQGAGAQGDGADHQHQDGDNG